MKRERERRAAPQWLKVSEFCSFLPSTPFFFKTEEKETKQHFPASPPFRSHEDEGDSSENVVARAKSK